MRLCSWGDVLSFGFFAWCDKRKQERCFKNKREVRNKKGGVNGQKSYIKSSHNQWRDEFQKRKHDDYPEQAAIPAWR